MSSLIACYLTHADRVLVNLELDILAVLFQETEPQTAREMCCLLPLEPCPPSFCVGIGDPNANPQICVVSTFLARPPSQQQEGISVALLQVESVCRTQFSLVLLG